MDNGIVVEFNLDKMSGYQRLPEKIFRLAESIYYENRHIEYDNEGVHDKAIPPIISCEVVYWRKWWGVRNDVMLCLGMGDDPYKISLTTQNLKDIIQTLKSFRNPEKWRDEGISVWDYEEDYIEDQIDIDINTIEELIQFIYDNDELFDNEIVNIYFYDSY